MTDQATPGIVRLSDGLGPAEQRLTGDVAWLFTHCRALGMERRSDSGLMRDDVALFAIDLNERVRLLELAEEGAKTAFAHVVESKRDLERENTKLRGLLDAAYADIRRLNRA